MSWVVWHGDDPVEVPPYGRTKRPRLLLAEDDDEIRTTLADIFALDGYQVTAAPDGTLLVQYLERARDAQQIPHVLVLDHRMPGVSGLEIARALREAGWPIPIIMITAFAGDIEAIARNAGADAVFQKPFDADDLRTAVYYCMQDRGGPFPDGFPLPDLRAPGDDREP